MVDLISVADAAEHLKVDPTDPVLPGMIAAAVGHLDGPNGYLGRALTPQTIRRRFPCFPRRLPYPPLIEVTSVKHRTTASWETLDASAYEVSDDVIAPVPDTSLPYAAEWEITWQAGYDGQPGRVLPPALRAAILLIVGHLYANRNAGVEITGAVQALLRPFEVYR